jgi:hypothetical protein
MAAIMKGRFVDVSLRGAKRRSNPHDQSHHHWDYFASLAMTPEACG